MSILQGWVEFPWQNETNINSPSSGGLDLRNSDGSLMAFVCSSLPEAIRRNLTSSLLACFDGREVLQMRDKQDYVDDQDSHDAPEVSEKLVEQTLGHPFQCLHFSLWNRYSTTVSPLSYTSASMV
jgi:hypothetical protein